MALLTRGNAKLGSGIWHFNLPAGTSCPGASPFCAKLCYAKRGQYRQQSVTLKYARNWLRAQDLDSLRIVLESELAELPAAAIIRIHTSGDFFSGPYIDMWGQLAAANPDRRFYTYTRSWTVPELLSALNALRALPNVTLWASTDPSMGQAPAGWREARIMPGWQDAPGYARCPEQTGRRASCSDCGLCFSPKVRPDAHLAFKLH